MKDVTPKNWSYFAPENTVIYAIGDLHGYKDANDTLYNNIQDIAATEPDKKHIVVYLGDYIDRGPQSADIINQLINLEDGLIEHYFLMGNHEAGLLGYMQDPHKFATWLEFGGIETSKSYGCDINKRAVMMNEREALQKELLEKVPEEHVNFINNLDLMKIFGDYCFVHAGIRPNIPLNEQTPRDLRYIRDPFLSWTEPHEKCIVHGHSISKEPEILPNRLGLDTGLFRSGILTCGILESNTVKILQVNDRD